VNGVRSGVVFICTSAEEGLSETAAQRQ
jgi:hypothetical protein